MVKFDVPKRITVVAVLITLFGAILMGRLFFLQVIAGEYYRSVAERQHISSRILEPRRGDIFLKERDKSLIPAATTRSGFLLYVDPRKIEDAEGVFDKLNDLLSGQDIHLDREDFIARATKEDDPFETILKRIEKPLAEEIDGLELAGVGLLPEEWRFYPADTLAAQVLGFVGFEGEALTGRYGIERMYEQVLRGEEGYLQGEHSATGVFLNLGNRIFRPAHTGYDVVLTIEPNVQIFLERQLEDLLERWDAVSSGGIIVDPGTGRILAMAAHPSFDPNNYQETENISLFVNPLVEHIYEMGSIFKPLTLAAAMDANKITPDTTYNDKGYVVLSNRRIENYDGKGRGVVDMQTVLNKSLNTGAVFVMKRLGKDQFRQYFLDFGLADVTGIELPGEVSGNLSNLNSGRDIEYATAAFGQGIAVTPIGMVRALSALANGGKLMQPYIVDRISIPGLPDKVTESYSSFQVIRPETSEEITRMLVQVVDDALLGGTVKLDRFSIAAKTGTAQIPKTGERGYSDDSLHSFFGYGPAFDAKFLIFLYLEKPRGVLYASQSLGQSFMDIMKFLLSYYEVRPDR